MLDFIRDMRDDLDGFCRCCLALVVEHLLVNLAAGQVVPSASLVLVNRS
jgi:hypothetical protein